MRYKEFEKAVEDWGEIYNYNPIINVGSTYIEIAFEEEDYVRIICAIHKSERFVMYLHWELYRSLSENVKDHLFKIVTEFAATPIEEREDEKRFIIPLPELITTDGKLQYLTYKDCFFFASRRNEDLRQIWREEHLKFVPEIYRQFAVEFEEEREI